MSFFHLYLLNPIFLKPFISPHVLCSQRISHLFPGGRFPLLISFSSAPPHCADVPVIELLNEMAIDRNYISLAYFGIVIGDEPDKVIFGGVDRQGFLDTPLDLTTKLLVLPLPSQQIYSKRERTGFLVLQKSFTMINNPTSSMKSTALDQMLLYMSA